jgi:hypothetical protein
MVFERLRDANGPRSARPGYVGAMGRESANYFLRLAAGSEERALFVLDGAGAIRLGSSDETRVDFCLRDEYRYWIDLRIHREPELCLEIRIALTNDQWSIRAPLGPVLIALGSCAATPSLRDEDGNAIAAIDQDGWSLALEQHYGELREAFVARVGDVTAPLSADHVYLYIHQTRWNRDNDDELAWHREREIAKIEEMWDPGAEP